MEVVEGVEWEKARDLKILSTRDWKSSFLFGGLWRRRVGSSVVGLNLFLLAVPVAARGGGGGAWWWTRPLSLRCCRLRLLLLCACTPLTSSNSNLNSPLDFERTHHAPSTRLHTTARPPKPYLTQFFSIQLITISQPPQAIALTKSMSVASRSESLHFNPET
ncbi:hypothetical protein F2Q70_00033977 [Brassica cretica]|uniref:Uncharacterized protein n=1 Tax=Brassica cretica TaxID=69181 RepID=A0A8S9JY81_BRACR|nr:hypothetical protein F2Q70_00033977 [Brassica cretica]